MTPVSKSLSPAVTKGLLRPLGRAWKRYVEAFPGDPEERQPVHSVYGGAHLFKADTAKKLGEFALRSLRESAPHASSFGAALNLDPRLAETIYDRVIRKLEAEAVETVKLFVTEQAAQRFGASPERIRREVRSSRWVTSQIGKRKGGTSSSTRMMPGVSRAISSIMAPMPMPWRTRAQWAVEWSQ